MDSSKWPSLAEWDPEVKKFNDENSRPSADLQDVNACAQIRPLMEQTMKPALLAQHDMSGIDQEAVEISFRDGTSLPALLCKPSEPSPRSGPLAVIFHGGGYFAGFPEMELGSIEPLVKEHGATVVCPRYRLAPEHPFPTPINDCWDALKWCAAHASKLGADPSKGFFVGGSSAGGHASAVLQHLARDEKLEPPLTACWLAYPGTLDVRNIPEKFKSEYTSLEQAAEGPGLNNKGVEFLYKALQPDSHSELWTPLTWPSGHAGLPRTYIQVCGRDPFRDDGLLYERELRQEGVETKLDVYVGCPHGVNILFAQTSAAKRFEAERLDGFRWLLRKK